MLKRFASERQQEQMGAYERHTALGTLALVDFTTSELQAPVMVVSHRAQSVEDFSDVELHLLGRVAIHCWTHRGRIPFVPPTAHQAAIARGLATTGLRLLEPTVTRRCQQSYRLTSKGERLVQRLFHLMPLKEVIEREHAFDYIAALLCHPGRRAHPLS